MKTARFPNGITVIKAKGSKLKIKLDTDDKIKKGAENMLAHAINLTNGNEFPLDLQYPIHIEGEIFKEKPYALEVKNIDDLRLIVSTFFSEVVGKMKVKTKYYSHETFGEDLEEAEL